MGTPIMEAPVLLKTKQEIIKELLTPYIEDPSKRAVEEEEGKICMYNTADGRHCVFAMACVDPSGFKEGNSAYQLITMHGIEILKPEYRHVTDEDFWNRLQMFHDEGMNFSSTGLTYLGKEKLEKLLADYAE